MSGDVESKPLRVEGVQVMAIHGGQRRIREAVTGWEGVTEAPHRFGGLEFRLGRRELGHVHGDSLVDIPFPKKVRDEIVAAGNAEPHHILPQTGWVSLFLRADQDVERAIELLHRSFSLALGQRERLADRAGSGT
jgi:Family of unknown function (DUF5519)